MPTVSKLFLPPAQLSGCMFAGIFRDTRGVTLSSADRLNHFPASPLVSVTQVLCGELHVFPTVSEWHGARTSPPLPSLSAFGPSDAPISSWSAGECAAFTIGFFPDSWQKLGGLTDYSDIPGPIAAAMHVFVEEPEPARAWDMFCDTLAPAWTQARPTVSGITDWAKAMKARAALSNSGRGLRSFERRIRRMSGQTRRTLDFFCAFENLHRVVVQNPGTSLAEIAQEAGYSDQSHMGRSVRRETGFSPAHLNRAIEEDEAFWCYRILGERY